LHPSTLKANGVRNQNDRHAHRGENVVNISSFVEKNGAEKWGTWAYVIKFSGEWW
jgi:hypothetical protein